MGPKRRRSAEGENKQQNRGSVVTRSKSSSSSSNNNFNSPVVVFAHGAGASSSSDWMISLLQRVMTKSAINSVRHWLLDGLDMTRFVERVRGFDFPTREFRARWKNLLTDSLNAVEVVTFDYPYISKRRPPPKAEKLVEFHSDIVKTIASKYPQHPLVLVGKSMGSRVSCMVAAENGIRASAVVCLGYPLKGAKGAIRDEPLLQLTVPTMFVQGTKDGLCPLESLEVVRQKMKALSALHVVENGDHSLKIAKKNLKLAGISQEEAEQHVVQAIAMFVSQIIGSR